MRVLNSRLLSARALFDNYIMNVIILLTFLYLSLATARITVLSGALNGTQITSAEFYKKGDDLTSLFQPLTAVLVDVTSSNIEGRIVYLEDIPKSQFWSRIFELKSSGVIGVIVGAIYPIPGQDYCTWTGEDVSQVKFPISTVLNTDFKELHTSLLNGEQPLIELTSEGNPWADVFGSITVIIVFRVLLGGFSLANAVYGAYKLALFIKFQGSSFNIPQVSLSLEIIANLWRIISLVGDPLGCNFVYGSAANSFLDSVSIPYQVATFALVAFYWFEIISQASIKIYPFLNRLKIPFFVITFTLIAMDMTISLLGFFLDFATTTPMLAIYLIINVTLLIFYIVTFVRLQRRMKQFGQARVKNVKTLSSVNMKMILNAVARFLFIVAAAAYAFPSVNRHPVPFVIGCAFLYFASCLDSLMRIILFDPPRDKECSSEDQQQLDARELPPEIEELIVSFMDAKTKRYFRQTCTRIFKIVDYRDFCFYFTRPSYLTQMVRTLSRYSKPISLTFKKTINLKPLAINCLSILTNITNLSIDGVSHDSEDSGDMSDLSRLTNLHSLQFDHWGEVSILKNLSQLHTINLPRSTDSDTAAILKNNPNLRHLDLWRMESLDDIQNISQVTSMTVYILESNSYESLNALEQAYQLKHLYLNFTAESEMFLPLRPLTALKSLKLHNVAPLTLDTATTLAYLDKLEELMVTCSVLNPDVTRTWTTLTSLKELSLDTEDEDYRDILQFITALSNLKAFSLSNTSEDSSYDCLELLPDTLTRLQIDASSISIEKSTRLTALQELQISYEEVSEWDYYFLSSLTNLTQLNVFVTAAHDSLTYVGNLTNMKDFRVSSYEVILDNGQFNFEKMISLESLDLPSHVMTDDTLSTLSSLPKLTKIMTVYDTRRSPRVLEHLPLKHLEVAHEENEEFWQSLGRITTLEHLKLRHIQSDEYFKWFSDLHNLTFLEVITTEPMHYTCITHLTSLQSLRFPALGGITSEELKDRMPYLYHANLTD